MIDQSQKKEEILLSVLDFLNRNGYEQSFSNLQKRANTRYIEQNIKTIEELISSNKIPELIIYINNNIHISNETKLYYIKCLKIKYYIKLVLTNCKNNKDQKDSLDYLRKEITPLLNKETELLNLITRILFIKNESMLNQYIKSYLFQYNDDDLLISLITKSNIPSLENIFNTYKESLNNINLNFEDYSVITINDNCLSPFKSSDIWFIEISKNKNYFCAAYSNANISIFNIIKTIKDNKEEIVIKLIITFSGNEENKRDEITAINFSNDEKYILIGLSNYNLAIYDISNGQKIKEYKNIHNNKITSIIPFPNSNSKFITGSIDKKINLLDISNILDNNIKEEYTEVDSFCRIKQLCYSELFNYIIIISASNTDILIYNIITKKIEFKIIASKNSQNVYANTSKTDKGKYLIYNTTPFGKQSKIILYNLSTKLVEEKFIGLSQKYMIIKCTFCGTDDKFILSGSEDYTVYMWERGNSHFPKYTFKGHYGIVNTVDMWDNDFILSGSDDKSIKIWYSKNEKLSIKYEKNNENKYIKKENKIDQEFLDAMNDNNDNMDIEYIFEPFPNRDVLFYEPVDDDAEEEEEDEI